jgi:hypothetical protein
MQNISTFSCRRTSVDAGNDLIVPRKSEQARAIQLDAEKLKGHVNLSSLYEHLAPSKFKNQKKAGKELAVSCVFHEPDNNPSLSINDSEGVYYCHACGAKGNHFSLIEKVTGINSFPEQLTWLANYSGEYIPPTEIKVLPAQPVLKNKVKVTRYDYGDGFVNERYDPPTGKKYFKQLYNGVNHDKGKHPKFPVYRAKECADAIATGSTWIHDHEGEKCCDFAWGLGYPSTTCYGNMRHDEYIETYQRLKDIIGRPFKVLVYQDAHDPSGKSKAKIKQETLSSLGIEYKLLDWSDYLKQEHGDIVDYISEYGADEFSELLRKVLSSPDKPIDQNESKTSNIVAFRSKATDFDQLKEDFDVLLAKYPKKSEITKFKAERNLPPEQSRLVDDWAKEYRRQQENEDNKADLLEVLQSQSDINLADFLDPDFAAPLQYWARSRKIPESCLLTVLLPICAHAAGQQEVLLCKGENHVEPAIIWSLVYGKSGSGKTPLFKVMAKNPLEEIQKKLDSGYELMKQNYEAWRRLPKDKREEEGEPQIPNRKLSYVSNYTSEAMHRLAESDPEDGVLILSDEFSGVLRNQGKYSNGKGSDNEEFMGGYDATPPNVARATRSSGGKKFFRSVCGATQVETLKNLLDKRNASSGEWSRYFFVEIPYVLVERPLVDDDVRRDFTPMLVDLFSRLKQQTKQLFTLTPEAYKTHADFTNQISREAFVEVDPSFQMALKKASGQSGRLALVLHLMDAAIAGKEPEPNINKATIDKAITLQRFYLGQVRKLYKLSSDAISLTPDLEAIIRLATRKGSLTPSEVVRSFSGKKRKTSVQARELINQLVEMGLGAIQPFGKTIKYIPPDSELINREPELIKVDKFINSGNAYPEGDSDDKEGKVDKIDKISFPSKLGSYSFAGITNQEDKPSPEKSSFSDLSTLSTLEKIEPESQSSQGFETVDKFINSLSTESDNLSTLGESTESDNLSTLGESTESDQKTSISAVKTANPPLTADIPLTIDDIEVFGFYLYLPSGDDCQVQNIYSDALHDCIIDIEFPDGSRRSIYSPTTLGWTETLA